MKKLIFLSCLIALAFVSCSTPTKEVIDENGNVHTVLSTDADITNYGNGVYYFNYTSRTFAEALSAFVAEHPELELVSFSGNGSSVYGVDQGYFVVFKKRTK